MALNKAEMALKKAEMVLKLAEMALNKLTKAEVALKICRGDVEKREQEGGNTSKE